MTRVLPIAGACHASEAQRRLAPPDEAAGAGCSLGRRRDGASRDLRWLDSYALVEPSGELGAVCTYQA